MGGWTVSPEGRHRTQARTGEASALGLGLREEETSFVGMSRHSCPGSSRTVCGACDLPLGPLRLPLTREGGVPGPSLLSSTPCPLLSDWLR